ncbi:MAG TPA: LacI family DNA-binding transcriptional regulator, partial [Actinomycetota bacterium]|nr:LacI family DNA-binding transcriptional regulator [Actinomycetota bacterium]
MTTLSPNRPGASPGPAPGPGHGVPRPTMRDVAEAAAVSLKTVSRVVNDEAGVRPDTAARVREAIATLGFRRNDMARVLRQGQASRTLGLVIEDVGNPFYSVVTRAVEEVARERGYLVITGSSDEDPARERDLIRSLVERRVDGLLVVPAGGDHRFLVPELRLGTAVVFMDRPPGNIDADVILLDNVGGARRATEHLLDQGHRRVAMVGDAPAIFTSAERLAGYRQALAARGVGVEERLVR